MGVKLVDKSLVIDIDDDITGSDWWGISHSSIKDGISQYRGQFESPVKVFVNSNGGSVTQGMAIRNEILNLVEEGFLVETEVTGIAASISSVIALAGTSLKMRTGSYLMIHRPTTFAGGNDEDFANLAITLKKIKGDIVDIYEESSNLSREDIINYIDAETWFTSKEAVSYNFADEVILPVSGEVMNMAPILNQKSVMLNSFSNIPEELCVSNKQVPREPITEGVAMKLSEFLAQNPEAKKEHDAAVLAASSSADSGGGSAEPVNQTGDHYSEVIAIMKSGKYPSAVQDACAQVLSGRNTIENLRSLVSMADMNAEMINSLKAQNGTTADGDDAGASNSGDDTPSDDTNDDTIVNSSEDITNIVTELGGVN